MVLQGGPCGRVDRRRTSFIKAPVVDFDQQRRFFMLICMAYLPLTTVNGFSTGFVFAHHINVAEV
jgi:hypothetical protein